MRIKWMAVDLILLIRCDSVRIILTSGTRLPPRGRRNRRGRILGLCHNWESQNSCQSKQARETNKRVNSFSHFRFPIRTDSFEYGRIDKMTAKANATARIYEEIVTGIIIETRSPNH